MGVLCYRPPMSNLLTPNDQPQFNTAEYSGQPGSDRCQFCKQSMIGSYFRVNGKMACSACVEQVRQKLPQDNHAAFVRGLLFGVGGAVLGLIVYAAFSIITGLMVGFVSLAVGYIVGKAIRMGSGGIGGRRYQLAAIVLTYAAVSIAAIPIAVSQYAKEHKSARPQQSQTLQAPTEQGAPNASGAAPQVTSAPKPPRLVAALAGLTLLGLASPFLELQDPVHGMIGLVILFVGLQIAWKITAGVSVEILGPFKLAAPSQPPTEAA